MQTVLNKKLCYMYFISAGSVEMQRKWNDFKNFNEHILSNQIYVRRVIIDMNC